MSMTLGIRVKDKSSMECLAAIIDGQKNGRWRWTALARAMAGIWGKVASTIDRDDA
jgi:hypothetical protein